MTHLPADNEELIIGRDSRSGADLVVANRAVSRRQATIAYQAGQLLLTHLGSVNPTQVERSGRTLLTGDEPVVLLPGDRVTLGGEVHLFDVVEIES